MAFTLTDTLRDEYNLLFSKMSVRPEKLAEIERIYARVTSNTAKKQYLRVEAETGVPWFVVGIIHNLEASGRFDRHLHNGDPLTGPTVHVPAGRPSKEKRAYTWIESAIDALCLKKLHQRPRDAWTLPDIAFVLESYNGTGYRRNYPHVKSPYLWSFSNIYISGKYVSDKKFSEIATSRQCGGLTLLKRMLESSDAIAEAIAFQLPESQDDIAAPFPWIDGPEAEYVRDDVPSLESRPFPNRYLVSGLEDDEDVRSLQERLVAYGFDPGIVDGDFGEVTERAVRLFQARSADPSGAPLEIDGIVGPLTWAALFGLDFIEGRTDGPDVLRVPSSTLAAKVLQIAADEVGARESPRGSNRGPRVDTYIKATGLDPAGKHPWCMCFVYWCFEEAARQEGLPNPCPKKASVHMAWQACNKAMANGATDLTVVAAEQARKDPSKARPGMIFFIDTGGGFGHVGIVESNNNGALETIEGNTNDSGLREGIGVFRRTRRRVNEINLGFVGVG